MSAETPYTLTDAELYQLESMQTSHVEYPPTLTAEEMAEYATGLGLTEDSAEIAYNYGITLDENPSLEMTPDVQEELESLLANF